MFRETVITQNVVTKPGRTTDSSPWLSPS